MLTKLRINAILLVVELIYKLIRKLGRLRKSSKEIQMSGIKETKEVMQFGIALAMAVDQATQDGFDWTDTFKLIPPMAKLPAALDGIQDVPDEINDLDDTERTELVEAIKELDFASDQSEVIAEQALRCGVEICNLITKIREYKNN